jgi:hypothetical protein
MRYLTAAFWARPQIPILRYLPWNALAIVGAAVGGFFDPMIWLTGLAWETLYLSTLATNPYFQRSVDARTGAIDGAGLDRDALLRNLGGNARQRFVKLEEKVKRIEKLTAGDDLLYESNRAALRKLSLLHLQLLAAQKELALFKPADADELRRQIRQIEEELRNAQTGDSTRETRQITLTALTQRMRNIERRDETLKEIDNDLARIEAQIDLAVENAGLKNQQVPISGNITLVTQLLDDTDTSATTSTSEAER